jgi:2-keto-3-deoxy-L-rhamnonate aldolase RhmA
MNKFRKALLENELSLGAWVQIGNPSVGEIFARSGFDWVCVDLEHGIIDLESMANIFRAIDKYDCVPVARLPYNDPIWIHRVLDAGAGGLIIPMVNSAEEAERGVREAKYPPTGTRGFGYSRANSHGVDFDEYIASANEDIAIVAQIEHKDAIREIDAILAVDGVDGVFIGPYDLSGSMGIPGQFDAPEMVAAMKKYLAACASAGKCAGTHIVRPNEDNIAAAVADGYKLIALGVDTVFLDEMSRNSIAAAREATRR